MNKEVKEDGQVLQTQVVLKADLFEQEGRAQSVDMQRNWTWNRFLGD